MKAVYINATNAILNIIFIIIVSPFLTGVIKKVKALMQGRRGQPLLQPYYNIIKLLKKETIYSTNSSIITKATPVINMSFIIMAVLSVPIFFIPMPSLFGNVILFIYLLAMAKFFMALAGLDAGSTFGGMGSSREMSVSAVFEPIIIIAFAALALVFKTLNLHEMVGISLSGGFLSNPSIILITISLFIILIVESSRIPVDNPETHLELTMIHEGMLLEHSGKNLALMELSHSIKQVLLMGILINIFLPWNISTQFSLIPLIIGMAAFILKAIILSIIVGIFESSMAKLRLFRLHEFFMIAFVFSLLTIIFEVLV